MDLRDYLELKENIGYLNIRVIPNSNKTELGDMMENGVLKIKSKGIPEKGKVNKEIINFISKSLKVEKSNIKILSGETSKNKLIKIDFGF